jgi:CBS domain-containing protein
VGRAWKQMQSRKIRHLPVPVVEGDRLVGMLTATDIIRGFVALLEEGVLSRPERWGTEG